MNEHDAIAEAKRQIDEVVATRPKNLPPLTPEQINDMRGELVASLMNEGNPEEEYEPDYGEDPRSSEDDEEDENDVVDFEPDFDLEDHDEPFDDPQDMGDRDDDYDSGLSHTEQCFQDRSDYANEMYRAGRIDKTQADEIRFGA